MDPADRDVDEVARVRVEPLPAVVDLDRPEEHVERLRKRPVEVRRRAARLRDHLPAIQPEQPARLGAGREIAAFRAVRVDDFGLAVVGAERRGHLAAVAVVARLGIAHRADASFACSSLADPRSASATIRTPSDDLAFGHRAVSEVESASPGIRRAVAREPVQADTRLAGAPQDRGLVDARRQPGEDVQPRRRADRPDLRQVLPQRPQEDVAATAVDRPHPAEMEVELAALEEVGEGELLEAGRAPIEVLLRHRDRLDEPRRDDHPAESQARGERLARGSGVDDIVRGKPVERPDRLAVVAVLGVVVVLEDQRVAILRPGDERRPPLRRQDRAGRELVSRRDDDGVGVGAGEHRDVQALVVDADRGDLEPVVAGRRRRLGESRVLGGDAPSAGLAHDLDDEPLGLGEAVADHDRVGVGDRAPDPVQVAREGDPELQGAARVEVA